MTSRKVQCQSPRRVFTMAENESLDLGGSYAQRSDKPFSAIRKGAPAARSRRLRATLCTAVSIKRASSFVNTGLPLRTFWLFEAHVSSFANWFARLKATITPSFLSRPRTRAALRQRNVCEVGVKQFLIGLSTKSVIALPGRITGPRSPT
jgi:hypothetical protein